MFGGGIAAIKTCVCLLWNMDKIHCHVDAQGPANEEGTVLYKTVQWWCMLVEKYLALRLCTCKCLAQQIQVSSGSMRKEQLVQSAILGPWCVLTTNACRQCAEIQHECLLASNDWVLSISHGKWFLSFQWILYMHILYTVIQVTKSSTSNIFLASHSQIMKHIVILIMF